MSAALDRCTAALGNPNVKAFLRVIRAGESSQDDSAYTIIYGGGHFPAPPWRHPYQGVPTTQGGKAAGAYQFLGTTWDRCASALGLGEDFSPASQDIGAVYLIDGRGALGAVENGDLSTAIVKLAQEWVGLPGLGARAAAVFQQYGGTQTGAGGAISSPDAPPYVAPAETAPAAPNQPQTGGSVFPLLLPALLQLVPQLAQVFGAKGEKVQAAGQIAQAVTQAITTATGTTNLQAGIEAMQADPAVKAQAASAVLQSPPVAAVLEAGEAGGGGIGGARKFMADPAMPKFWQTGQFWISLLLMAIVGAIVVDVLFMHPTGWTASDRSQVLMLAVAITSGVMGFWIGSSIGSAKKDEVISRAIP